MYKEKSNYKRVKKKKYVVKKNKEKKSAVIPSLLVFSFLSFILFRLREKDLKKKCAKINDFKLHNRHVISFLSFSFAFYFFKIHVYKQL